MIKTASVESSGRPYYYASPRRGTSFFNVLDSEGNPAVQFVASGWLADAIAFQMTLRQDGVRSADKEG